MKLQIFEITCLLILLGSCSSKPKVIAPQSSAAAVSSEAPVLEDPKNTIHKVVVKDFLDASRYTYLNVTEDDKDFWIAIPQTKVEKGETYYYQGGVLTYNFESKEHNRIFETLYLVGGISKVPGQQGGYAGGQGYIDMHGGGDDTEIKVVPNEPEEGGVTLESLFSNMAEYSGKVVKVKGTCVKINRNIMGKNWIHLQDGTKDSQDNNYDLTITTLEDVPEGEMAIFEGTITLGKDFGSGYRYDIILEESRLLY